MRGVDLSWCGEGEVAEGPLLLHQGIGTHPPVDRLTDTTENITFHCNTYVRSGKDDGAKCKS